MVDFLDDALSFKQKTARNAVVSDLPPEKVEEESLSNTNSILTVRGTEDGLIFRIDGRTAWPEIVSELEKFLGGKKKFFEGGHVGIEWLERLPTKEQSVELAKLLKSEYGLEILKRKKRPNVRISSSSGETINAHASTDESLTPPTAKVKEAGITIPLFDEVPDTSRVNASSERSDVVNRAWENIKSKARGSSATMTAGRRYGQNVARLLGEDLSYDEDANAKVFFGTLRSGQRIETPFSLVVVGDVNPGADLVAGGDIVVLGSLRGTAHASAYDDDSYDCVIIATHMQPMQLRIGSVISRGSGEVVRGTEIARIENRRIIVEKFNTKAMQTRKFR